MAVVLRERKALLPRTFPDGKVGVGGTYYEVTNWDGGPGDPEMLTALASFATEGAAVGFMAEHGYPLGYDYEGLDR